MDENAPKQRLDAIKNQSQAAENMERAEDSEHSVLHANLIPPCKRTQSSGSFWKKTIRRDLTGKYVDIDAVAGGRLGAR